MITVHDYKIAVLAAVRAEYSG